MMARRLTNPACFSPLVIIFLICFLTASPTRSGPADWENTLQRKAKKLDGNFYYVGLQDVADVLGLTTYYSSKVRKAILYIGDQKLTITAFSPFVLSGRDVIQLPVATRYDKGDILVPVTFFAPLLRQLLPHSVPPPDKQNEPAGENIVGVRVDAKANGTLIRVVTAQSFEKGSINTRYSRKWLYLDILGGKVNPKTLDIKIGDDFIKKIVPVQMDEMVQLSFQLKNPISKDDTKFTQRNNAILISIPSRQGVTEDVIKRLKQDQEKWRIDKIIIDPGHGGKDPGTSGKKGTKEKDVVLGIAKKLKKLIEQKMDAKVLMTRDSDKYVSLKERTRFANRNQGKLFISIHANWNRNSKVAGTATYFLGQHKSDEALEIAQRENSVIKYEDNQSHYDKFTDEQLILIEMAQNAYNKQSQDLAAIIQEKIHRKTHLRNRGVKQAGFYVLWGASMPNVLIETAFMSNKEEERLLRKSSSQQKIAEAILESVILFKEKYEWAQSQ